MLYHVRMAAITLQNVCRQFGTQVVLQNVSLELQSNQIAGLVGDNGSGKTTLFKLISGDLQPDTIGEENSLRRLVRRRWPLRHLSG